MTTGIPDPAPPFDTQRAVENLQAGGFSGAQAAALARTLVDATANLVTKADLKAGPGSRSLVRRPPRRG